MQELTDMLKQRGAALVGFADLAAVDEETRQGFPRAVSAALALDPGIIAGITDGPTEAYCGEYDRANALLGELADAAGELLTRRGRTRRKSACWRVFPTRERISTSWCANWVSARRNASRT